VSFILPGHVAGHRVNHAMKLFWLKKMIELKSPIHFIGSTDNRSKNATGNQRIKRRFLVVRHPSLFFNYNQEELSSCQRIC